MFLVRLNTETRLPTGDSNELPSGVKTRLPPPYTVPNRFENYENVRYAALITAKGNAHLKLGLHVIALPWSEIWRGIKERAQCLEKICRRKDDLPPTLDSTGKGSIWGQRPCTFLVQGSRQFCGQQASTPKLDRSRRFILSQVSQSSQTQSVRKSIFVAHLPFSRFSPLNPDSMPAAAESPSPIGIANLPNQRHKIVAKRGAAFTIMVCGIPR